MSVNAQHTASPLYAVIDLGSNSFHMLVSRLVADSVQTVDKVKRKVRLASGLDEQQNLSEQAMLRGLECLSFFAERLQDINPNNIQIVATATLRIAKNADVFLRRAEKVLGYKISVLSGTEEAKRIYLGVAHTSASQARRLVLDIGGASTEIVVGGKFDMDKAISLDMGCVTFNNAYFKKGQLTQSNFDQAISAAKSILAPEVQEFKALGWHYTLGGSGTMQALAEILMSQNKPAIITHAFLIEIQQQLIQCEQLDKVDISGLLSERIPVIASGLSILIALFESFDVTQLQLSSGALREGLLYEMLPDMRRISIRERTIDSLVERFHIDSTHANRVRLQAETLLQSHADAWQLADENLAQLVYAACNLHEVGLLLSYKHHAQHGAYILKHADLPGFDQTERQLLVWLVDNYKGDIDPAGAQQLSLVSFAQATRLLLILRLATLFCRRRQDDILPEYTTQVEQGALSLSFPSAWLDGHPLLKAELCEESKQFSKLSLNLTLN